tara:strand:+ start:65 stop:1276 length:1212 start_codon:yes stop_codon:yes gene_type:complete
MEIQKLAIEKVIPYIRNPRKNENAVEKVASSIHEFGFRQPIVVDDENVIIAGHTRFEAAKRLGMDTVPVHVAKGLTEQQVKAYRIADNRVSQESEWDMDLLKLELEELDDPELSGFDPDELQNILVEIGEGLTDPDEVPDVPDEPTIKLGDLLEFGGHRLLCGDSTKADEVEKLMDGAKSNMVFTDPPYNVNYGESKNPRHKIREIENDSQSALDWEIFCNNLFQNIKDTNLGDIYLWGASGADGMRMRLWLIEMGCRWSATIIWKKQRLVLSPSKYQRMYEPCFYGWFDKSSFQGDRKQVEVWEFDRPHKSVLHPTMKPVEVCENGITNSSKVNDIVLDLFLGSGSTLIACQKSGRKCYGMELDPHYCDVIVTRWSDFTGKDDVLINGEPFKWSEREIRKVA